MSENNSIVSVTVKADSLIEELFYIKCEKCRRGKMIRKQWDRDKEFYRRKISLTVFDYEHYSLHDESHSISILNNIAMLLGERVKKLCIGDVWLLLEVAYSHDIGMSFTDDRIRELWNANDDMRDFLKEEIKKISKDERANINIIRRADDLLRDKKSSDSELKNVVYGKDWPVDMKRAILYCITAFMRNRHGEESKREVGRYQRGLDEHGVDSRIYGVVGDIAYLHTRNFDEIFRLTHKESICFGEEKMHPQFVAALLRMGDILDMDNSRYDELVLKHYGNLPDSSKLHYRKHKALAQFNITEFQVEAVAKSDDIVSCGLIADWFKQVKEENDKLILYWNTIAPQKLKGCRLNTCNLKIFCDGHEYNEDVDNVYKIDKRHATEILIGENLYDHKLDFLREYVQNAIDASKLEFFREMEDGDIDYLKAARSERIEAWLPFLMRSEAYEAFAISVVIADIGNGTAEISITDKGVGIEESAVDSLTTIGRGWRGRPKFNSLIKKMPYILKPTGGFGIGIQAAFMLADLVTYMTKSKDESLGHIITLENPNDAGRIYTRKCHNLHDGTTVSIRVPLIELMERGLYTDSVETEVTSSKTSKQRGITIKTSSETFFSNNDVLKNIKENMKRYMEEQFVNVFFPISLQVKKYGGKEYIRSSFWYNTSNSDWDKFRDFSSIVVDEKKYYFSLNIDTYDEICVIDTYEKRMVRLSFIIKKDGGRVRYCYKGIALPNENEGKEVMPYCDCMIDIWGRDVKEYIKVNRRGFAKDFNKKECLESSIKLALKVIIEIIKTRSIFEIIHNQGRGQFRNLAMTCIHYIPHNKDVKEILHNYLFDGRTEDWRNEDWIIRHGYIQNKVNEGNEGHSLRVDNKSEKNIFEIAYKYIDHEPIFVQTMDAEGIKLFYMRDSEIEEDPFLSDYKKRLEDKSRIVLMKDQAEAVKRIDYMLGGVFDIISYDNGLNFRIYDIRKENCEETNDIYIDRNASYQIIDNPSQYDVLWVREIPLEVNPSNQYEVRNKWFIIMPFSGLLRDVMEKKRREEDLFENFLNQTIYAKDTDFSIEWNRLIDWVYEHQLKRGQFGKSDIEKAYKEILLEEYVRPMDLR